MIITRTPFRVSFFGGGTDYPTWYREHGGAVLATTIDKYCYISCRHLPPFFEHKYRIVYSRIENQVRVSDIEHPAVRAILTEMPSERGLEIHHDGDLPARSGLGSSSSFTVGLIQARKALDGQHIAKEQLAAAAIHMEQDVIKEHVGSQDQICAACGGFNNIEFLPDGRFVVRPLIVPAARLQELNSHCMLFFTGLSRFASEIAKSKIDNFDKKKADLHRMREMVTEATLLLQNPNSPITEIGKLLAEGWERKRTLSDRVSTPLVDELHSRAMKRGAVGGKLLGAGGGGFMLIFAEPDAQPGIREALSSCVHVPIQFESEGSKVVLYQPNGL